MSSRHAQLEEASALELRLVNAVADARRRTPHDIDASVLERLVAMQVVLASALEDGLADDSRLAQIAGALNASIDELRENVQSTATVALVVGLDGSPIDPVRRPRSPIDELTPREREVLALMARGKSNRAIADDLTLTKRAVEKHVGSIFMKLMLEDEEIVSRRVGAVLLYLANTPEPALAEPFLTSIRIG